MAVKMVHWYQRKTVILHLWHVPQHRNNPGFWCLEFSEITSLGKLVGVQGLVGDY
jgi:hypothetical protein